MTDCLNNLLSSFADWFFKTNRTSDHIFTLRALIEKYSHLHKQKLYACFVDFKKAFDSVWYAGLFYRLLDYGIGDNIYNKVNQVSLFKKLLCGKTKQK